MRSLVCLLLVTVLVCIGIGSNGVESKASGKIGSAAVPRKKSAKGGVKNVKAQGFMNRMFRELKISFCSELEALTLQITRPNPAIVPLAAIEEVVSFMNNEYDNPALVVSLLAKLSRKCSEANIYTKLKSLVSLHKIEQNIKDEACVAIAVATKTLRKEVDEKIGELFFSVGSIDDFADTASTVAELEAIEIAREFSSYVFDYIDLKGGQVGAGVSPSSSKASKSSGSKSAPSWKSLATSRADALVRLLDKADDVEECTRKGKSPIFKQCIEGVRNDRSWISKELKKIYESGSGFDTSKESDQKLMNDVEEVLKRLDSKFEPTLKRTPPATTSPAAISEGVDEVEEEE